MLSRGKSVLIVDDSTRQTHLIEAGLRHAGLRGVFTLPDGERVAEHLSRGVTLPDLIVLDRSMPGLDGFGTLEVLRRESRLAVVAVVMVSGSDDTDHIAHARHVGADGYMAKPSEEHGWQPFAARLASWSAAESWRALVPCAEDGVRDSCDSQIVPARRVDSVAVTMNSELAGSYPAGHLNHAAHIAQIPLSLALNLAVKDFGVAEKRRNFVRVLFSLGWTKPEIRLYLNVSQRWLEEQQGKPVQSLCGIRAALLE